MQYAKRPIRLIATDLDGTLLPPVADIPTKSANLPSPRTLAALNRCREQGIPVAVATARSEQAAAQILEVVKPDAVISNGGACVRLGEKTVHSLPLPSAVACGLSRDGLESPAVNILTAQTEGDYYVSTPDYFRVAGDYGSPRIRDFSLPWEEEVYKITLEYKDPGAMERLVAQYPECRLTFFRGESWCSFSHRAVSKLDAVEKLASALGLELAEVAAFGDDANDRDMVGGCGWGVAVANAVPAVLAAAKYHTASNGEDGVAQFLEAYLRGQDLGDFIPKPR